MPVNLKVIEVFQIAGLGTLVLLKNEKPHSGLRSGAALTSIQTGTTWVVKNRIIEFPDAETSFEGEKVMVAHIQMASLENKTTAAARAKENEQEGIFQYLLESPTPLQPLLPGEILTLTEKEIE